MSLLLQENALRCINVDKSFSIEGDLKFWRILFDVDHVDGQIIHALRDISLSIPKGKIVGILGKNGAGKSTLLRVLGGVYEPTRGEVISVGEVVGMFELGGMGNPNISGRDYASTYLRFMGAKSADIPCMLDEIKEFSELEDAFDQCIRTYSTGMGARLYFATATSIQKEIYLIDELLSVGDEHFQAKCWARMRKRLLNGASGVLVTHDWSAVLKLCEKAYVIEKGEIIFFGRSDLAVVSYLKIPKATATFASFSSCTPQIQTVKSGQDAELKLHVTLEESRPVDLAISVEMLNIGIGWEIILLINDLPVADKIGSYEVNVLIPKCPLAPGSYALCAVLSHRKNSPQDPIIVLDSRSWTQADSYTLLVEGKSEAASVKLPYKITKLIEIA